MKEEVVIENSIQIINDSERDVRNESTVNKGRKILNERERRRIRKEIPTGSYQRIYLHFSL